MPKIISMSFSEDHKTFFVHTQYHKWNTGIVTLGYFYHTWPMNKIKYILQVTPALQVTPVDGIVKIYKNMHI